jgi:monovalent cation/proton antiporter MnhG/PhaG subunit
VTVDAIAVAALLLIAVLCVLVASLGVLLASDAYTRLHYMAPVATLGIWAVAAAVLTREWVNQGGVKALLIAIIIFFMNAVLSHATARAARMQQYGTLEVLQDETQSGGEAHGMQPDPPRS